MQGKDNVLSKGFQASNWTAFNRYPSIFKYSSRLYNKKAKILSFGCSSGEEVFTLASMYFNNSVIIGSDRDEAQIQKALTFKNEIEHKKKLRNNNVDFSFPDGRACLLNAPYNLIFAMSVFCRWPDTQDMNNISTVFAFNEFLRGLVFLDSLLDVGGTVVLYNTNYSFEDTEIAESYRDMKPDMPLDYGFVTRFLPDGEPDSREYHGVFFTKVSSRF